MSIKKFLPWYFRIIIKFILSRLPFSYTVWSRIGFFRHGAMDDFNYAWDVLKSHKNSVNVKNPGLAKASRATARSRVGAAGTARD